MSATTQAIALTDKLVKAKLPKAVVVDLLEYVDSKTDLNTDKLATKEGLKAVRNELKQDIRAVKQGNSILWKVMLAGFVALLTVMIYLHSDLKTDMNTRIGKIEDDLKDIKELLQKR